MSLWTTLAYIRIKKRLGIPIFKQSLNGSGQIHCILEPYLLKSLLYSCTTMSIQTNSGKHLKYNVAQVGLEELIKTIKRILQELTINFSFESINRSSPDNLKKDIENV